MLSGNPPVLLLPCDDPTSEIFSAINIPMGIIPFQTQFALLLRPVGQGRERPGADAICSHSSPDLSSSKRTLTTVIFGAEEAIRRLLKGSWNEFKSEINLILVLCVTHSRRFVFNLIACSFNCN